MRIPHCININNHYKSIIYKKSLEKVATLSKKSLEKVVV